MNDPYVTTREAARAHGVAESTIRSWVRRGLLHTAIKVGRTAYYRLSEVDEAEYQARTRDVSGRSNGRLT